MCGLAGLLTGREYRRDELERIAGKMSDTLVHRGPDDSGIWVDASAGIALGFRRLAIVDLSEHGHQPMASPSGRFTMVFNGEIYNHDALRAELRDAGFHFRGHSDTEMALAAFERWGITAAVRRFVGMFAIALWDAETRTLSLIRDRLGIKPLYIAINRGHVTFGSELKALLEGPEFDRSLDYEAVGAYLRYLYVPAPASIFRNVRKLLPGHILTVRATDTTLPPSEPYWSIGDVAERGRASLFGGSDGEAVDELERLLDDAIRLRLQADVPVGALLSGGLDSSAVVAIAQRASPRPLKTYSIGFDVEEFNEAPAAAAVARHLGTDHTEWVLSGRDALDTVPQLPELFDEPLANPSHIPTFLVCGLARREVTVALSGDGGDEILGGYHRYIQGSRVIAGLQRVPFALRRTIGAGIGSVSATGWDRAYRTMSPLLPASARHRLPGEKIGKVGTLMGAASSGAMYQSLLSARQRPEDLLLNGTPAPSTVERTLRRFASMPLLDCMMATDQTTYLADDLLAKVDRASMATSLELRVPLLDHRVVEFAWTLPDSLKIRGAEGKWALRQVLYRHVPRELVDRPKMGFTTPTAAWLSGPLHDWASDLIHDTGGTREDLLNRAALHREWDAFCRGETRLASGLWAVLQLLAWRRHWRV